MYNYPNYLIPVIPFSDIVISHGKGSYIFDVHGEKYLDLNSGQFCTIFGHTNSNLLDKINKSSYKIVHTASNILTEDVLTCSKAIYDISGDMNAYSIILNTGAEVIEFCLRYAKYIQNKTGIVCFENGYHGLTLGAQSVTYSGSYARPKIDYIYPFPVPDTFIDEENLDLMCDNFNKLLRENDNIAAVLMEPIVSVGGMIIPPPRWFKYVRKLCYDYNILLIFDECQTGFGRLGNWFAYQKYGVIPDMVATAKGIGQGYPVALAMFRNTLIPNSSFGMTHYSSHQNDPFAANIINYSVEYIEHNNIMQQVDIKGTYFKNKLFELQKENNLVKNARGCGLMLGIDLHFNGVEDYRNIYKNIYNNMLKRNVIIQGTNGGKTIRFLPDYLIELSDIDFALNTLNEVLSKIKYNS
jgi:4-aminobutyrate aminotransferase-like enzyme